MPGKHCEDDAFWTAGDRRSHQVQG
uniref:Uncharacterized protein n=1 Tax=Anguilla anguilla TaxID=7936 RepID=A0A0E9SJ21_ANGAN